MLLQLNFSSDLPIYQQIRNQIVVGIASGQLNPGDRLPTIRALADESGVNVMTVNKAYSRLSRKDICWQTGAAERLWRATGPELSFGTIGSNAFRHHFRSKAGWNGER